MDVHIDCICPGTEVRHPDGDTIVLKDKLDFVTATSIRKSLSFLESDDESARAAEVLATLVESYVLFGIATWTLIDEKGRAIPVKHSAIREHVLSKIEAASVIGDVADDLYKATVLLPLVLKASRSSPPSQINGSTSPPTALRTKRPKPSKPSSTSTSPTDATEMTSSSLDGVSSTSQKSVSAA
jgi:hypothetical protein